MMHKSAFKYRCEECDEPLPGHPEPGEYVATCTVLGLSFDFQQELPDAGVKCWRCATCGERTWVYGFALSSEAKP